MFFKDRGQMSVDKSCKENADQTIQARTTHTPDANLEDIFYFSEVKVVASFSG
jgi:hypothetical protein